ncbi:alpha-amylase family glycosyl hydrolase [Sphingomonas sp. LM7]|uniref:alpha-amylase family glycosyl hydrolase n=1 Tax=Sphingomonas sp. LM7 TaxID=1938607 RepID=UPI000983E86F|nr:alpha-amylase family glycosyl hydrolase [Sphingomonas sp. LM7]AQR74998.1 alpha-amylase [Sphingomonas sp. LM7]
MKLAAFLLALLAAAPAAAQSYRDRLPEDEILYFLLPDRFENGDTANDRGGLKGDRLVTGFDPTHKGFYHGGDLKGLLKRLDYVEALGATAIWVGPIFRNKPVQGPKGQESAGYHGYWVTDFTRVDPHLGSNADFKALVDAAHARGIKVYMDIIVNHTADVIQYRECGDCAYRSRADYPYGRKGGVAGEAINDGFAGDGVQTPENFAKLTRPDYAYTPFVPAAEKDVKVPAWLNDPIYYHNRGNSTFAGESSTMGDFVGLDDVATEHPRVIEGMIEIFGSWIDRFGIDGFRIDTARHVNPEFWTAFVPAMEARAKAKGIPNFHIFGEVADPDPAALARHTRIDKLPTVLDFAFARAVNAVSAGEAGTDKLAAVFAADPLYEGGEATARRLPTFIGNHDQGRAAYFIRKALPGASPSELLARTRLAHAMLLLLRGVPTIYSGDEQGFVGDGDDQNAREDMFASKTAVYNDNQLLGTDRTNAVANFNADHPLFREIATLSKLRRAHPALTRGRQILRFASDKSGLFAVSRFDPVTGGEILIAFNSSATPWSGNVEVDPGSAAFEALAGVCPTTPAAPGSLTLTIPAFGYAVCAAGKPK